MSISDDSPNLDVAFVVVTHNATRWLGRCLPSLRSPGLACHTIIVDNGSGDGTPERIKNDFPDVQLLEMHKNLGFGAANNAGIHLALRKHADYVFLLNQDAWVVEDSLGELVAVARRNPEFGIVSPMHLDGSGQHLDRPFLHKLRQHDEFVDACVMGNRWHSDLVDIPFVNAAAWLVSGRCLREVGGFNPAFFHYGEDRNYCQRVVARGFKIGVCPSAAVCHDRDGVIKVMSLDRREEWEYILQLLSVMNPGSRFGRISRMGFVLRRLRRWFRGWANAAGEGTRILNHTIRITLHYRSLRAFHAEQESGRCPFL